MINKIICVCSVKDINVFEECSKRISNLIKAKKYIVIVPKQDLEEFKKKDLQKFKIISEEKYSEISNYLKKKMKNNFDRFGWYFQQFIKISELDDGNKKDLNVIWDSDTIPLKNINFEKNGKIFFYQSGERHKPYFALIEKILGKIRLSSNSFIAQCFPCQKRWIESFKTTLENKFDNKIWYQVIIDNIDFNNISGFSEYETLGNYIYTNFSSEIELSKSTSNWSRRGNYLIGNFKNIDSNFNWLSKKFDYIAFEKWDRKKFRLLKWLKLRYF